MSNDAPNIAPPTSLPMLGPLTAAALDRVSAKYEVLCETVLRAFCGIPIRGRAVRERARLAAAELGAGPATPARALDALASDAVREALALALTDGLAGFPAHPIEIVSTLLGTSEVETLRIVTRARERLAATTGPAVAGAKANTGEEVAA